MKTTRKDREGFYKEMQKCLMEKKPDEPINEIGANAIKQIRQHPGQNQALALLNSILHKEE